MEESLRPSALAREIIIHKLLSLRFQKLTQKASAQREHWPFLRHKTSLSITVGMPSILPPPEALGIATPRTTLTR